MDFLYFLRKNGGKRRKIIIREYRYKQQASCRRRHQNYQLSQVFLFEKVLRLFRSLFKRFVEKQAKREWKRIICHLLLLRYFLLVNLKAEISLVVSLHNNSI